MGLSPQEWSLLSGGRDMQSQKWTAARRNHRERVSGLTTKKITIAFARAEGRSDIRVELDLTVIETDASGNRTRSSKAVDEFLACLSALKLG
jgi:hypothetical protein